MLGAESNISVYYDGLCPLCSKEIGHYRNQKGSENFKFLDITSNDFDAKKEGLDPYLVHKVMHVKLGTGELKTGVDAFIEIWRKIPRYQKLARIAENKGIKFFLNLGYRAFAQVRPYLPRKKNHCADSPYCETKQ